MDHQQQGGDVWSSLGSGSFMVPDSSSAAGTSDGVFEVSGITQCLLVMGGVPSSSLKTGPQKVARVFFCIIMIFSLVSAAFDTWVLIEANLLHRGAHAKNGQSNTTDGSNHCSQPVECHQDKKADMSSKLSLRSVATQLGFEAVGYTQLRNNFSSAEAIDLDITRGLPDHARFEGVTSQPPPDGVKFNVTATLVMYTLYPISHVSRCVSLVSFHYMRAGTRLVNPNPETRSEVYLLTIVTILVLSTIAASVADYDIGEYPCFVYEYPGFLSIVTIAYVVSHASFMCCLILILSAGQCAIKHVTDAAGSSGIGTNPCDQTCRQIMTLRRKLCEHCDGVRWATLLAMFTLLTSSVASGLDVWNARKLRCPADFVSVVSQFVNVSCWMLALLLLLRSFVQVHDTVIEKFTDEIVKKMEQHGTPSSPLSPETRVPSCTSGTGASGTFAESTIELCIHSHDDTHRNTFIELKGMLDLLETHGSVGWFLFDGLIVTQKYVWGYALAMFTNLVLALLNQLRLV